MAASAATSFDNFENGLSLGLDLQSVWIVHQGRVKLFQLVELDESTLVPESLLGKILAAFVPYEALALPSVLLLPILEHLLAPLSAGQVAIMAATNYTDAVARA